jgi:hypothetical protein
MSADNAARSIEVGPSDPLSTSWEDGNGYRFVQVLQEFAFVQIPKFRHHAREVLRPRV